MGDLDATLRDLDQAFFEDVEEQLEDAWHFVGFLEGKGGLEATGGGVRAWYAVPKDVREVAEQLKDNCEGLRESGGEVRGIKSRALTPDELEALRTLIGTDADGREWEAVGFLLKATTATRAAVQKSRDVDVELTIGAAPRSIILAVRTAGSAASGTRTAVMSVTVTAETVDGGVVASTMHPPVGVPELKRFRAGLMSIRVARSGSVVFDGLDPVDLELSADESGFHARWSHDGPFGPPGVVEGPFDFSADVDEAELGALIDGCAEGVALLDALGVPG